MDGDAMLYRRLLWGLLREDVGEGAGEDDVGEAEGGGEQRGDVAVSEAGDAAADAGDVEFERRMGLGKLYKLVDVWLDGGDAALHGGDGV